MSDAVPVDLHAVKNYLDQHPHVFVRALISAQKTGKLDLSNTPYAGVDLDVVTLTRVDGRVRQIPIVPQASAGVVVP